MKIVNILGGLGNQMFEYAMYLALKDAHPQEEIKVCTRSYNGYGLHNGLEIQRIFRVELPEASLGELTKVAYPFFSYNTWRIMRHWLPNRKTMTIGAFGIPFDFNEVTHEGDYYYDGYWQNEKNFKHIRNSILETYTFPEFTDDNNKQLANHLRSVNAVSCHIRRGDYLKEPAMCVCTPEYYKAAFNKMNELANPELYVIVSDDIPWCKENLHGLIGKRAVLFMDWNRGHQAFRDMQIMSLCKHNIIANSSFSWWGAWLNKNEQKIVIAPEAFSKSKTVNDPICEDWIKIKSMMA